MFEIKVVSYFCAAHYLENYKGKCESLHGHNWRVEVVVYSKDLDSRDMIIDFKDLRKLLEKVLSELDHKLINELSFFKKKNTTSERIAQFIFRELKKKLDGFSRSKKIQRCKLKEVVVWEQENACAVYREKQNQ